MANKETGMIKIRKSAAAIALIGAAVIGGGGAFATQNAAQSIEETDEAAEYTSEEIQAKDYTLMFYVIGSDLESDPEGNQDADGASASGDFAEIAAAMKEYGLDESVNVVAEIGGTERWSCESLADVKTARITIDSGGINVTERLPDLNMGESAAVTEFIDYAYQKYPAEHYLMVFWNHGNGPAEGYGYDVLHDGDSLTLQELNRSFENAVFHDFDLIGFDACCMGNIETANALWQYTDYLVASPACEDENGWDYAWLEALGEDSASGEEIGKRIVDTFAAFYDEKSGPSIMATLSCYDMTEYEELYQALQAYNGELLDRADEALYEEFNGVRNHIAGYYSGAAPGDDMELLDLKQLYRVLGEKEWESYHMEAMLDKFICSTTVDTEELCGISIYVPKKSDAFLAEHMLQYLSCLFDDSYLKFIYNYARMLDKNMEMDLSSLSAGFDEESMEILFEVEPSLAEQMASVYVVTAFPMAVDVEQDGYFTAEEETDGQGGTQEVEYYLLSTDSDVKLREDGLLSAVLDMKYFAIADQLLCLIEQFSNEEKTNYLSPILYNGRVCMMLVEVSLENPDGSIVSIMPYSENGPAGKEQYALEEGAEFAALYPILTKEGEIVLSENLTDAGYFMGERVTLNDYDCQLDLMDVEFYSCVYGLMIRDKNLGVHYSELSGL